MSSNLDKGIRFKSAVFYALSDPIRLEIVSFLRSGEKCVCEIVPHLSLVQPLVSRHLKILKDVGIVKCRKDGTKRMYAVVDDRIHIVTDALTSELLSTLSKEAFESVVCS